MANLCIYIFFTFLNLTYVISLISTRLNFKFVNRIKMYFYLFYNVDNAYLSFIIKCMCQQFTIISLHDIFNDVANSLAKAPYQFDPTLRRINILPFSYLFSSGRNVISLTGPYLVCQHPRLR